MREIVNSIVNALAGIAAAAIAGSESGEKKK
ncbi:MAG: hypothetical protein BWX81_02366 [Spirochaetes bacterium ADurb.Bin110]|nr:MAG: hypothetical protein BWX81_02366 [Spirochaetes bacterium ADurb.Bin110]